MAGRDSRRAPRPSSARAFVVATWLLAGLAGALFTWLKLFQYRHWLLTAWDTGIYLHAMARIASGDWTGWNGLNGRPIAGDAAQWIVYALAPLLRLGGPPLLFALQGFALAFGAVPLALLAWRRWGSFWALVMLPVLYAFPGVIAGVVVEWHPDALGFCFLAWAVYALESGRGRLLWPLLLATLSVKNQAAVAVAGLGRRRIDRRALPAIGLPLALLLAEERWILPRLAPGLRDHTIAASYGYLGSSLGGILLALLRHPAYLAGAVTRHAASWALALGFFAGLPLLAPLRALPALAVLLVNGLSRLSLPNRPYTQYTLWAAPFLAWGAVEAAAAWSRLRPAERLGRAALPALLLLAAAGGLTLRATVPELAWRLRPLPPPLERSLDRAAALVPRQALLFGQTGTVVAFYDRPAIGAEPYDAYDGFVAGACRQGLGGLRLWLLWAPGRSFAPIVPLRQQERDLAAILASGPFRLRYAADGVLLYESAVPAERLRPAACLREKTGATRLPGAGGAASGREKA